MTDSGFPKATRRAVLKAGLAAGAITGTGVWARDLDDDRGHPGPLRQPGSLPFPRLPPGTDTLPQIEHIVVLMMENHSFDNRLGMLERRDVDGFRLGRDGRPTATNPYPDGTIQHAFRMPTTCQLNSQPSQEWTASHRRGAAIRLHRYDRGRSSPSHQKAVATARHCHCLLLRER